jgi:hypothetical protein
MACDRWRVWCVDLYVGQEAELRRRTKKDRGVCALLAPAELGLKETAFRLVSGGFASNGETTARSLVLLDEDVKDNREQLLMRLVDMAGFALHEARENIGRERCAYLLKTQRLEGRSKYRPEMAPNQLGF